MCFIYYCQDMGYILIVKARGYVMDVVAGGSPLWKVIQLITVHQFPPIGDRHVHLS